MRSWIAATLFASALAPSVSLAASAARTADGDVHALAASGGTSASRRPPAQLSPEDWHDIRAAHAAGRRTVRAAPDGHVAVHPAQKWRTHFDGRGFVIEPDGATWNFGLELQRWGFPGAERATPPRAAGCAAEDRLEYAWEHALTEWYVNGASGLEHGYTVHERPDGGAGPLTFTLAVRGGLQPRVREDLRGVDFVDETHTTRLTYTGLVAFDADGHQLGARIEDSPAGLRLSIDERDARYPLTIDPIAQQGYLKASNTGVDDGFGYSVAVDGNTVVVGAWNEDSNATGVNGNQADNSAANAGAAYVFVRSGTGWSQQAYLKASNAEAGDEFGFPVAVSGNTIVVGARLEGSAATGVNGNQADNSAGLSGAAYVFVRSGTTWTQQAYLKASNTEAGDVFGSSLAVWGDTVVVGSLVEASNATGVNGDQSDNSAIAAGAAYVFVRNGANWSQQAYLKASNTESIDQFSFSLAICADTIAVSAVGESSNATGVNGNQTDNSLTQAGAVYVFVRGGTSWSQQAYLKASNTGLGDRFGQSVSLFGNTLLVGAPYEDGNATGVNGNQSSESAMDSGAAYVLVRNGASWSQQAYLKASNTGIGDEFGGAVAVSDDLALVGAVGERSNATGVNGNQADNSLPTAGAAYLYSRSGATWSHHSYLKASNTGADDAFGVRVAASGSTLVIGAFGEDSNATGVGGNQASNSGPNSGAAYSFFLDDSPLRYCVGDGTGIPCPCSPAPVPHGAPGNGCPNDINPAGASLSAAGTSSLTADTLVLQGTGMNNSSCAYFQGDARRSGGLGSVFGDGLRCVTSNEIRLRIKFNVAGASQYPDFGDNPISVAGLVASPGQKHYQCWYRSGNPAFCTPDTFNLTNGLSITWAP